MRNAMKIKMILPALTEAKSPYWRPIKYSLFPPLGLATLAAYRAYALADHYRKKGAHVCLGGLHVSSLPEEATPHADSIFIGPGEDVFPQFLEDFRKKNPKKIYINSKREIENIPPIRRDLIKRHLYL